MTADWILVFLRAAACFHECDDRFPCEYSSDEIGQCIAVSYLRLSGTEAARQLFFTGDNSAAQMKRFAEAVCLTVTFCLNSVFPLAGGRYCVPTSGNAYMFRHNAADLGLRRDYRFHFCRQQS